MNARPMVAAGIALVLSAGLVGCTESPRVDSEGQNYVSGDGTVTEFSSDNRGEPIEFTGSTETDSTVTSEDYLGGILVVNFWYATCPPCRLEAPWLEELNQKYENEGVKFLGVNVRDGAETSQAFASRFGITYPSVIDEDGTVSLAFSGIASPAAVPTTVVLDREGRPASRIVGLIEKSTLDALIKTALDESVRGQ